MLAKHRRGPNVTIAADTLRRVGIKDSPRLFEEVVSEAIEEVLAAHRRTDPGTALTSAEQEALRRGGLDLRPREWGQEDPLLKTAADYAVLVASGHTVGQAAGILGVDPSRIRQRLAARTLYGIKAKGAWRLPRFQFSEDGLVPHLELVLPRLREGVHPVGLWRWFVTPNSELTLDDEDETPVSPRAWLLQGLDPTPVADLASEL
jgi:hypothetical protein